MTKLQKEKIKSWLVSLSLFGYILAIVLASALDKDTLLAFLLTLFIMVALFICVYSCYFTIMCITKDFKVRGFLNEEEYRIYSLRTEQMIDNDELKIEHHRINLKVDKNFPHLRGF